MRSLGLISACLVLLGGAAEVGGEELQVKGPLRDTTQAGLQAILPPDTHLLLDPASIEAFLDELDGTPPDWKTVYGHGHHDPGHDDRLFDLNRARDAKREGKPALSWLLSFVWLGELSPYNPDVGGFSVAVGPKFTATRWGMARFKPEEVPGNLVVVPNDRQRETWQRALRRGEHVEIDVVMTGRLIPDESLVYDFSHDEEGLGLIMPFVRVEQIHYVRLHPSR